MDCPIEFQNIRKSPETLGFRGMPFLCNIRLNYRLHSSECLKYGIFMRFVTYLFITRKALYAPLSPYYKSEPPILQGLSRFFRFTAAQIVHARTVRTDKCHQSSVPFSFPARHESLSHNRTAPVMRVRRYFRCPSLPNVSS